MSTHPSSGGSGNSIPRVFVGNTRSALSFYPPRLRNAATENQVAVPLAPPHAISAEEREEREWEEIVNKPHVKNALRRMAAEALRRDAAGELEEGGFAVE